MPLTRSITDHALQWPAWETLVAALLLRDYNTRVVVLGVVLLGVAAGLIGSFLLLRKRALLGDALSHATLPGIGVAFLVMSALGGEGKWLPGLLLGATISGVLGVLTILLIVHTTRIKEDAALGIVLSVFFGLGVAIMGIIQRSSQGNAAGLNSFIYGKTASMLYADAMLITYAAGGVALICALLYKEFALLCFDATFARSQGWPVLLLDVALTGVVVAVTVIGLQAVGLILIIALLVIPPAAARFWTHHLPSMLALAAIFGAVSGYFGAVLSALLPRLPAGAIIVLVSGVFFLISMMLGGAGGALPAWLRERRLGRRIALQHLLRAMYELGETDGPPAPADETEKPGRQPYAAAPVALADLLERRSWSRAELLELLRSAARAGLIERAAEAEQYRLTPAGVDAAARLARNHRLWELYLITHADIAPSHVDRDADEVEHVLDPAMIAQLERLMPAQREVPPSPHRLPRAETTA